MQTWPSTWPEKAENTTQFANAVRDEGVPESSTCVGALRVDQVAGFSRTMEIERPRYGGITPGADAEMLFVRQMAGQEAGSLKAEVVDWIQTVSGFSKGDASVAEWLHDGRVLCALINAIRPGAIPQVNEPLRPSTRRRASLTSGARRETWES